MRTHTGGTLYVVATPIGNLEDITLRALRILKEVDVIAAEDTRHTSKLLAHYDIRKLTVSYHEHNERRRAQELVAQMKAGRSVALVSDAGMPGLSDPGYEIVRRCAAEGIPVVPVPGPSAILAALVASGLPTDRFLFLGFLPRKPGARDRLLEGVAREPGTLVLFEAPQRLVATLRDLHRRLGDRRVAICRELTKRHEEVFRGTLSQALAHAETNPPRGEITIVLERGRSADGAADVQAESELHASLARGASVRDAADAVARSHGIRRRTAYRQALRLVEASTADVFAYGTLRDPALVERLTGRAFDTEPAVLPGWRAVGPQTSRSGYEEIAPDPHAEVHGLLLRGVDAASLRCLDAYEVEYERRTLSVRVGGHTVPAQVYLPRGGRT
ncbi:MAG: 16S rRNA (cytidine(1402)-2'-O)-methyltransferase [Armatimonadota bacterium]|nr:16S rRNA (cytidine(1402)-2'-O)-methyltransferase [Armatimonadota bacterium]MDR5696270.1 16S rRNA (cytidine(1402)-2'-O)-methyltransferase [Armatimonadota bacterium]